ncbi:putative M22 peptidase homolog HI_0388 [Waddlia chondrophila 2032/99]|uniref:N(6)-L-threonylcarbamoyladenine synthase n=2 Tax=Waddlia chondrophila TaxID=71667 RepID=D6YRU2_WADCW|nr:tRNA (adenosine(37)-N6)-threonylcarbamoyltransferase complex dimerization subunit type 1 TsaB [Waddlia chondrophila]ADI38787.1 putative peptidase [Waddlia chondrophila WSU 86-1044]CCB90974.1 putative M22 peptidase homolog HI_0388 [Waddlia chondrophila 2032/99]
MLTLVVDVCSDRGIAAFIRNGKVGYFAGLPLGLHNSKFLMPKIEEGLKVLEIQSSQIELIAVGIGPGSYTGMRVGSMVAKALSFAHGIPLIGVSSLEGYLSDHQGIFAAMIDAKMAGCYLMKGRKKGNEVNYLTGPEVWKMEHIGSVLKDVDVIVSPHCRSLQEKFQKNDLNRQWEWQETAINVEHFASRAEKKYRDGEFSIDGSLDLLYMRG